MKLSVYLFTAALIGCAAYSELKPKPELTGMERGYLELQRDQKYFELKKNKKYFVKFPRPAAANSYLYLGIEQKDRIRSYATRAFDDGKGTIVQLDDLSPNLATSSLFDVDTNSATCYWVIDSVSQDMVLKMNYRYVPIWRWKVENYFEQFTATLAANRVDRKPYTTLGGDFRFTNFDFPAAIKNVDERTANVMGVRDELKAIESVFPNDIVGSQDTAYIKYQKLSDEVADEIRFQENYRDVLVTFRLDADSRGDELKFVKSGSEILKFLRQQDRHPDNVNNEAKRVFGDRLPGVRAEYEKQLLAKTDLALIPLEVATVESLYVATRGEIAADFAATATFIRTFNTRSGSFSAAKKEFDAVQAEVNALVSWPENDFYSQMTKRLNTIDLAASVDYATYQNHACAKKLEGEVAALLTGIKNLRTRYERSEQLVAQINTLRGQEQFGEIVRLLKKNKDLDYMTRHYADVDDRIMQTHEKGFAAALESKDWEKAEGRLRGLFQEQDFLGGQASITKRNQIVQKRETELWSGIETESRSRALAFIDSNKTTYDKVEDLYKREVFTPVYDMTFTAGAAKDLTRRKTALNDQLTKLKTEDFPATAIEILYKDFTNDIRADGVAKAQAVAYHGRQYKGKDRKIINLIAECDPRIPKWITKPATYRKMYVVPLATKSGASNEYLFRLNVQIESDAQFPVFDINIKLPEEIAAKATKEQWYDEITVNKKIIKNEGRVTIVAPSASNGYEMQITPVQMVKGADNIVEFRFKHSQFKVFEVSCMAQKPLIKKN